MALRNILKNGNDTLRKHSRPVTAFDKKLATLLDDMKETLEKAEGVGLAAPQVGILRRVFIVDTGEKIIEFVNPEIIEKSGEQDGDEGCLSVPRIRGKVKRPMTVTVRAQTRKGEKFEVTLDELAARCVCHENDHLDGILFIDKAYATEEFEED